jgi:integrase/recombinase XerD
MRNTTLMGPWARRFLLEHLVAERNLARNTQCSYRDTMVLLLPFMSRSLKTPVDRLTVSDLTPRLLRRFLEHLEKDRACSGGTRNLRLALSTRWLSSSALIVRSMWLGALKSGQFLLGRLPRL